VTATYAPQTLCNARQPFRGLAEQPHHNYLHTTLGVTTVPLLYTAAGTVVLTMSEYSGSEERVLSKFSGVAEVTVIMQCLYWLAFG
jgi:hypothetical protein